MIIFSKMLVLGSLRQDRRQGPESRYQYILGRMVREQHADARASATAVAAAAVVPRAFSSSYSAFCCPTWCLAALAVGLPFKRWNPLTHHGRAAQSVAWFSFTRAIFT